MPILPHLPRPGRLRGALLALALVAAPVAAAAATAPAAHADSTSICTTEGTLPIQNGEYTLQANEWNSTAAQCVTSTGQTAWSVSTANFNLSTSGAPATYPSLYKGCHWGACTTGSNLPIQVSNLGSATSSWSTEQPASGAYDVSYDLWTNSTPTTTGQPNGSEIMIWLNSRGGVQPFGSKTGTSTAAGHSWDVWTGQQTSWKIISYVLQGGGTSFSNLDVAAILKDAEARGSVNPQDYLIDAEAGFEIWQGGQGLATDSFSFDATAANGTGSGGTSGSGGTTSGTTSGGSTTGGTSTGGTSTGGSTGTGGTTGGSTTGGSGSAGCSAAYTVTQDWGTGFNANVTVTDTGSAPLGGWTVGWTWSGNQTVANLWNGVASQSGTKVTVANESYNGALSPGGSTSFGLTGSYSGVNAAPALTCTAS